MNKPELIKVLSSCNLLYFEIIKEKFKKLNTNDLNLSMYKLDDLKDESKVLFLATNYPDSLLI